MNRHLSPRSRPTYLAPAAVLRGVKRGTTNHMSAYERLIRARRMVLPPAAMADSRNELSGKYVSIGGS